MAIWPHGYATLRLYNYADARPYDYMITQGYIGLFSGALANEKQTHIQKVNRITMLNLSYSLTN